MKTRRRRRRSHADIAIIRDAIRTVLEGDHPMTVRQVFYQLVSKGVIDKSEPEYKRTVVRLLVTMRVDGEIPFNWVSDNTRWMRKPRSYSSAEEALRNTARTYRRALWDEQDAYVEIWTEKDALAGVLMEETALWDVPLMVSRGFSSITYLHHAAESIRAYGKPAFLYHFGDLDPSGVAIDRSIEKRLREFSPDAEIHFERIAVTRQQIIDWRLPTRPTKASVEVDAIPAGQLRALVRACIEQHVDQRQFEITRVAEQSEREMLIDFANAAARRPA